MSYNPGGLIISLCLIGLFIFLHYRNFKPKFIFPVAQLSPRKYWIRQIARFLVLMCVIILPLHLGFLTSKSVVVDTSMPIQVLLDVSLSMSATDISPSRFSAAKTYLIDLVRHLPGYDVSLIAFSGLPFVTIPFSHDTSAIVQSLKSLSLTDFPAAPEFLGTAIGDALLLGAANIHRLVTNQPGIVVLITDGDTNKGYDPADVLSVINKQNISVWTLAIGQSDYLVGYDQYQQPVTTTFNLPLLQRISAQTSGSFLHVLSTGDLQDFFSSFLGAVKARETPRIVNHYFFLDDIVLVILMFSLIVFVFLDFDFAKKIGIMNKKI